MDAVILAPLFALVVLGPGGIPISARHPDGSEMLKFMEWAQRIWAFRGGLLWWSGPAPALSCAGRRSGTDSDR